MELLKIWLRSGGSGERRCDRCRAKENETVENPGAKGLVGLARSRACLSMDALPLPHCTGASTSRLLSTENARNRQGLTPCILVRNYKLQLIHAHRTLVGLQSHLLSSPCQTPLYACPRIHADYPKAHQTQNKGTMTSLLEPWVYVGRERNRASLSCQSTCAGMRDTSKPG